MPLLIKQIVVKAIISDEIEKMEVETPGEDPINQELIIDECIDRVLEILKDERER